MKAKTIFTLMLILFIISCTKDEKDNNPDAQTNGKTTAVFNPNVSYGTLTDQEGNTYKTVVIGTQTWMAENLRTSKYRNGELIETTNPSTKDITSENSPKYQWTFDFNIGENNLATYGRMYTWYSATDSRNIAPSGWHVPTNRDWQTLYDYLGNKQSEKLRESGTIHWTSLNSNATNETGFTALPAAIRSIDGTFDKTDVYTMWWSSSDKVIEDMATGWSIDMDLESNTPFSFNGSNHYKKSGLYVRCVKD